MRTALGIGMAAALSLVATRSLGEDPSTKGDPDHGSAIALGEKTSSMERQQVGGGSGEPQRVAATKLHAGDDAAAKARAEREEAQRAVAEREFVERIWTGP